MLPVFLLKFFKTNKFRLDIFLTYVLVLVMPTQLAKHFWPQSVLLNGLRVDYLSLNLSVVDIILLLLLGVFLYQVLSSKAKVVVYKPWLLLAVTIFLWNLLQLFWVPLQLSHLLFSMRLFVLILVSAFVSRIKWQEHIVALLFFVQYVLLLLLSLMQISLGRSLQGIWYFLGERYLTISTPSIALAQVGQQLWLRPYATFSHPNVLAGYVCLSLVFLLFWQTKTVGQKMVQLLAIGIGMLLILLSFSQAAWFVLAMIVLMFLGKPFLKHLADKGYSWFWFGLILISLLIPFLLLVLGNFFRAEELLVRNQLFETFWKALPKALLGGYGWWGFLAKLPQSANLVLNRSWLQPAHHVWWSLIGSVGLLPMVILFFYHQKISLVFKSSFKSVALLVTVMLLGSFDHYLITQQQTLVLLFFLIAWLVKSEKPAQT
ncbi:hypothetical protein GYA49_06075 [Candidatus Beckwithbacteria bacterium]|nr:hypothetical protein [Candidatus Beckwithbacteria bacterium]